MPFSRIRRKSLFFLEALLFFILCFSLLLTFDVSGNEKSLKTRSSGINYSTRVDSLNPDFIRKYAPILNFHPEEGKQCCYPSSAEVAYIRAKEGKTGKMKLPVSLEAKTPCYFEALHTATGFRIKYWFWYNYNDYPTGPDLWGSHPGDWEYISIYFENNIPVEYIFSNHKGIRCLRPEEVIMQETQVMVWVGMGSHANYESSKPRKISSVLGFSDKIADGGAVWNTADSLIDIRNTNFCIDNFRGDWGDGKKIFGPISRTVD